MQIKKNVLVRVVNADIIGGVFNIPESITSIGNCAFYDCSGLTSIVIPKSVRSIGYGAFDGCSGLTSVAIPESVTSIGYWAFRRCSGLTSVIIPKSVTSIEYGAFDGCSGLTSIAIPESVTSISDYAFDGCTGLTSVIIPKAVKSIGDWAFYGCTNLLPYSDKSAIIDIALELLPEWDRLRICLDKATRIMSMRVGRANSVQSTFPNFTREIAIEKFGGRKESSWWPKEDKTSRIKFLEYLRYN